MRKRYKRKGFTLVELILVISVGLAMSFASFQGLIKKQEEVQSSAAGQQLRQVGMAVNNYVENHYDTLSSLTSSTGTSTDPGPRTCVASTSTCTITLQTLINEGYLPSSYGSTNVYGASYNIYLKRTGTSPYYMVSGIVLTSKPWITGSGTKVRYDLLGTAMQTAGIDSAMTKSSATVLEGYKGNWNNTSTDYAAINQQGLLGYQVGFGTNSYSVYLRRDGTLPMTGSLNMGANDINNAKNINASGTVTAGGAGVFGGEVTATNALGDKITIGGDSYNNDYEIRLGSGKPLTIYSPNAVSGSTVLYVGGIAATSSSIYANGLTSSAQNSLFSSQGAIVGNNLQAISSIGAGNATTLNAYMNASGNIYASNDILSQHYIYTRDSTGTVIKAYLNADGQIYASGNISSDKEVIAHNGYGDAVALGGDAAGDDYELRLGNNARRLNIWSSKGSVNTNVAGVLTADSRITTGEYLQVNGVATLNGSCSPNGLVGRDTNGSPLSCISGVWKKAGYTYSYYSVSFSSATAGSSSTSYQRTTMGSHLLCMVSGIQTADGLTKHVTAYLSGSTWILEQRPTMWPAGIDTWAQGICID